MSSIRYTENVAAIHELGHALVACAVDFPFSHVELLPNDKVGWAGKCHTPATFSMVSEPMVEAFNLAGPVAQSTFAPESLGIYRRLFTPSIFEGCQELEDDEEPINAVFWWNDYGRCNYHGYAADIHNNEPKLHKPHLLELEAQLKSFLTDPNVSACMDTLVPRLVATRHLEFSEIYETFALIPPDVIASLKGFVDNAPDPFRES